MTFAIMIPTRNRRADLESTCASLINLRPLPDEVLICVDGCQDNTVEMLRTRFPQFVVLQNPVTKGSVHSRDQLLRFAKSDIVVSLDDDSCPIAADFLQQLGCQFSQHPEAAVITFPEQRLGGMFAGRDRTAANCGRYVSAYANCAAAMRRKPYLAVGGFCGFFEHMYEEPDYALQSYAAGAAVWFEPSLVVEHRESPKARDLPRRHQLNARNELWSVWLRCPWPWVPLVSGYRIARQFSYAFSKGFSWVWREPFWWFAAFKGIGKCSQQRQAIPWATYYRWMRLPRKPIYSVEQLQREFPMRRGWAEVVNAQAGRQTPGNASGVPFGTHPNSSIR
ncbi:MAG TPA: glycosyltransferase family A protein [Verrucomicrobiae bacterium]|nr:glycosyltransferase family A protein [Verrucomicrobiae bacterium]